MSEHLQKIAEILMDQYRGCNVRFTIDDKAFAGVNGPGRNGMITVELGAAL